MSSAPAVSLRPEREDDQDFLQRLFASTRVEEPALIGWSDERREAFLAQQFHAQSVHYAAHYSGASFELVLVDGGPAGRLIVDRREDEFSLIDIALMPEHRGRGIGTGLVQSLLHEASERGAKMTLHVERFNRASRLYERLGFALVGDMGVYLRMERPAGAGQAKITS